MQTSDYHAISDPIGAVWLLQHFNLTLAYPLYMVSQAGGRRESHRDGDFYQEVYQYSSRPDDTIIAHLQFHLRHEYLHYELLSKIFTLIDPVILEQWVANEPTGQYARRVGFLYEWFTRKTLALPIVNGKSVIGGNYVDAVDATKMVVSSDDYVSNNNRWRIKDNLAGTPDFCPMLVKTPSFQQALQLDIATMVQALNEEFGEDLLMRSAVWITLRESKASFIIEGEGKHIKRIERFAQVIATQTGQGDVPITAEALAKLQQAILGEQVAIGQFGLRQSPVFVGQVSQRDFTSIIHYIAPPFEKVADMLHGLNQFIEKTTGQSAVMRSAVVAFAFVYIHPLADGNGRVHRFLMNDMLRRDGVVPAPFIIPISEGISGTAKDRREYDQILDTVSIPLMRQIADDYQFKETIVYADGIRSNLHVNNTHKAQPIWQYLNLTPHVSYLANLLTRVIEEDMAQESRYLLQHDKAREAIKEIMEMSNDYVDTIIRSVLDNQDRQLPSQKLLKAMPWLADDTLWEKIRKAVLNHFIL